jgi:hypothetical protein
MALHEAGEYPPPPEKAWAYGLMPVCDATKQIAHDAADTLRAQFPRWRVDYLEFTDRIGAPRVGFACREL